MLEEQHRVGVLDGGAEHPAHVGGRGRDDDLQAGDVRVGGLDRLRVVQRAVHAAAPRRPHHQRHREVAVAPVVDAGRLRHELVEAGVDEVGELDLGDRTQPGQRQPDPDPDDRALGQRGVEHARLAELLGQVVGGAEHAAARAHVLAEDHHAVVGREELLLRPPDGVDDVALGATLGQRHRDRRACSDRSRRRARPGWGAAGWRTPCGTRSRGSGVGDASADLAAASTDVLHLGLDALLVGLGQEALLDQVLGDAAQRVLLAPRLHLLRRAVGAVVVVGGVGEVAVGLALHQRGAVAAAGVTHRRVHGRVHVERDRCRRRSRRRSRRRGRGRRRRRPPTPSSSARRSRSRCSRTRTPSGAGGCRRS